MFWQFLAWAAVALLTVFRVAMVVGFVALVIAIVHALRISRKPTRPAGAPARK